MTSIDSGHKFVGRGRLERGTIHAALGVLGVDRRAIYSTPRLGGRQTRERDFWKRHEHDLPGVLLDFRRAYRSAIKRAHTDLAGGSHERAAAINLAWSRVRHLFARRGVTLD